MQEWVLVSGAAPSIVVGKAAPESLERIISTVDGLRFFAYGIGGFVGATYLKRAFPK